MVFLGIILTFFMKKIGYNLLLFLLRTLVYSKRGLSWVGELLYLGIEKITDRFWRVFGFRLYKLRFVAVKHFGWMKSPWQSQVVEIISRRGTLQLIFLVVCFFVLIPHTKLYARDSYKIPGQETLLFALAGPGEEDFSLEEIVYNQNVDNQNVVSWRDTAVSTDNLPGSGQNNNLSSPTDISGISAGGLALTKPTILPGITLPTQTGSNDRSGIIIYEVKSGDVIGQIATQFDISVETILWANSLSARSYIRPGDKLKILPVSGVVHLVKKGENISKITRIYDVSPEDVIKVNKLQRDGSDVSIGEELIIPGGKVIQIITKPASTIKNTLLRQIAAPLPSISAPAGSGYLWPTVVKRITQYFGWRHTGLDIAGPIGTPIYAARTGKVVKAQGGYNGGYGNYIVIDHGGGVTTAYGHSSKLLVEVGEYVEQGQVISFMGSTGRSTGPHLHFEVRINGARQNPLKYIR